MKVNSLAEWLMCRYFFHGPFGNWMFSSAGAGFRQESLKGDPEAGRQAGRQACGVRGHLRESLGMGE